MHAVIAAKRENVELKGLMLVPNAEVMMFFGGEGMETSIKAKGGLEPVRDS